MARSRTTTPYGFFMSQHQQAKKKTRKRAWKFVSSEAVWMDGTLSIDAIAVWHILSIFADHKTGLAWPSTRTIQVAAKMGRHRVNQAVKELIKAKAISRELKPRRDKNAIYGSTAYYTVTPLHKWVTKKHVLEIPESPKSGQPETGLPEIDHEHIPTKEHIPTPEHLLNTSPQLALGSPLSLTIEELETLVAVWGFEASVASMVFAKLEAGNWRDPQGRPFPNRRNLENYALGLANKINAKRTGGTYEPLRFPPASGSGEKVMAPVETGSQDDWREPDNDGPQDG